MDTQLLIKCIIRTIMCLSGIIGNNWLCISSFPRSMSQLKTADILFVNLAVSNLITNYLVDTATIFQTIHQLPVGKVFCGFLYFLPDFSETSSIFSTMYITMYWHQKLVGSLKRGGAPVLLDNHRILAALLIGTWAMSFGITVPHFFFFAEDNWNMTSVQCNENELLHGAKQAYDMLYLVIANAFPLAVILYASIHITVSLMKNVKRMNKMSAEVKSGGSSSAEHSGDSTTNITTVSKSKAHNKSEGLVRAAKSVVAVGFFFLICWTCNITVSIQNTVAKSVLIQDMEDFIGASYTCTIPYIYLYGVQKLTCSRHKP